MVKICRYIGDMKHFADGYEMVEFVDCEVIVRNNEKDIVMDVPADYGTYNVRFRLQHDNTYLGKWTLGDPPKVDSGDIECRFYKTQKGFALIGTWIEDGLDWQWFGEFAKE